MRNNSQEIQEAKTRRYWQEHFHSWEKSGLSQSAYCRHHAIKYRQWSYWKKRLTQLEISATFVPVDLSEIRRTVCAPVIRVVTPNGFRIEIEGLDSLGQLIREVAAI